MGEGRRVRGGLEQQVIATLGGADRALTPGEVRDLIDADLAYTTVMTVLNRLTGKGILARHRAGRAYAYRLVSDEVELAALRMRRLLETGGDRVKVLTRFVGALSAADESLLAELLREVDPADGEQA